jgi:hypothetical protein
VKNDGTEAQDAFLGRWNRPGVVVERFRDLKDLRGLNKGRQLADFAKPSDFLVCEPDGLHFAEVKSCQGGVSFPFANIEDGQRSAALKQHAIGGGKNYRFYIFSYGLGRWFVMDADKFAFTLKMGRSSVKFMELTPW